ncbi:MAG: T9SS type A sorting domain-containing protein [Cytophagales bacterium]|nr:T9SS type A sorting domain-containing protein [Cytophagales bacterium]
MIDYSGKEVLKGTFREGAKNEVIKAEALPSGMYFYRLVAGGSIINTEKILFTK